MDKSKNASMVLKLILEHLQRLLKQFSSYWDDCFRRSPMSNVTYEPHLSGLSLSLGGGMVVGGGMGGVVWEGGVYIWARWHWEVM
jgi:hypothetical protein